MLTLVFWWACAAVALPHAEPFLQRAAILFPLLLIVTIMFGQFHEARQFDALIPVAIALILSLIRKVLVNTGSTMRYLARREHAEFGGAD